MAIDDEPLNGKKLKKYKKRTGKPRDRSHLKYGYENQLDQKHFLAVEYFMQGLTRTESLLKAGFAPSTARTQVNRIFGRTDVQREIEKRRQKVRTRSHIMVDRVIEELSRIAYFNIGHFIEVDDQGNLYYDFTEADMEDFAAIGAVTIETYMEGKGEGAVSVKRVKVVPYDKKAALDSMARIFGIFQDNLALSTGEGGSLEERLMAGRNRMAKRDEGEAIEGEVVEASQVSRETNEGSAAKQLENSHVESKA